MSTVPFDTLKYLETLKEAGIPEEQARALTTGLAEAVDMNLATKQDIKLLKQDIELLKNELTATMWKMQLATVVIIVGLIKYLP